MRQGQARQEDLLEYDMRRHIDDRFSLDELKEQGFDFIEYNEVELALEYDYFTIGYNKTYNLITIDGVHDRHAHTILSFADDIENYHIDID